MADIPENPSGDNSRVGTGLAGQRLDPRTGMVSPAAWRTTTNESNLHPSPPTAPGGNTGILEEHSGNIPAGHRIPGEKSDGGFRVEEVSLVKGVRYTV